MFTRTEKGVDKRGTKCVFLYNPASIYLFKLNNEKTRSMCEICSKLTLTAVIKGYNSEDSFQLNQA